jgi:predicted ATPase
VVLWNPDQLSVLLDRPLKVVLDAGFGCGKTLLMKSFARQLANCASNKAAVIFVSLSAARTQV